jgi:hypothetical protein
MALDLKLWGNPKGGAPLERSFNSLLERYGHYSLYRRYSVGAFSQFYKSDTGSSSGGPKWKYVDEVIKIRHDPQSTRGSIGITVQTSKIYMKTTVKPKRGDVIIEVDYEGNPTDYELYVADHTEAFEITEVDPKRGLHGRTQYYICQVSPHMGDY